MLPFGPEEERAMATASFNSVQTVRAAIRAQRAQEMREAARPPRDEACPARLGAPARGAAWLRGVGEALAIASGSVAFVTALRWLLGAS
jgi:hypothetical protein